MIYIPSLDAKDIYLAENFKNTGGQCGYSLLTSKGQVNFKKYINTLDYSLDQIKLREVYEKVYRRMDFSFKNNSKEYTNRVINVTFKYVANNFNKISKTCFVKFGYCERNLVFKDCIAIEDGELVGVIINQPVEKPIDIDLLGKHFKFENGVYKLNKSFSSQCSTKKLREHLYQDGFVCDGIKYIRWKRSSGSSRVGKCLFIDEKLYGRMHHWEMCGLKIKEGQDIDLAALESYISLPSSSIIDVLEINPHNILVIDDYKSVFKDNVISIGVRDGELIAERKETEIENSIWDGQGLIDSSAMGKYQSKGMILLRNLFFKCCCFNCNIQKWFADNGITKVEQLQGFTQAERIEDIKLITTPSSIKYLKFGDLDVWRDNVGSMFGVVKYDKKTRFFGGKLVQVHYQLLNSLQMTEPEVREFLKDSFDYLDALRSDPAVVRYHIKYPINAEMSMAAAKSKNDIVYKMLGINDKFSQTKLYKDFLNDLIKSIKNDMRMGKVLVNGNYSTMLGNPIEMLLSVIGKFDGQSKLGVGNIHNVRFPYNRYLVGSRSPHISMSNVWTPVNVVDDEIDKYFNLTDEIVCINSIGENVLNTLSGSDFDSDTVMLTDNEYLLTAAFRNKGIFPVAISDVPAIKTKRKYTTQHKVDLDIKTSNNLIGDIVNLSQELNTLIWHRLNNGASVWDIEPIYDDVCKLNVMSCIEIDKAKKEFSVNNAKELMILREKYSQRDKKTGKLIKPNFFAAKDKKKGFYDREKKSYLRHDTTMDYVQREINRYSYACRQDRGDVLQFSDILMDENYNSSNAKYSQVQRVLEIVRQYNAEIKQIYALDIDLSDKYELIRQKQYECNEYIGKISFGASTMIYLLRQIECPEYKDIRFKLFNTLFGYPNTQFFKLIRNSKRKIATFIMDGSGNLTYFGIRFRKNV